MGATAEFFAVMAQLKSFPIFLTYLIIVFTWRFWGRKLPALNLKRTLLLHNAVCVVLSVVTFAGMSWSLTFRVEHIYSRKRDEMLVLWFRLYWYTKLYELLDTVYMMLRHRARQISFLHIYHHSAMVMLSDYAYNISAWPCMGFPLALNSLVHVFVYAYYGLSAIGPVGDWFKMFLTQIQIAQFLIGLVHAAIGYWYHQFCIYSILFGFSMLWLFGNFYYRTYVKGSSRREVKTEARNGFSSHWKSD